jgi:hypothetical protein
MEPIKGEAGRSGPRAAPCVSTCSIAVSISTWYYAKRDQGVFDAHVSKSGQRESSWKAAGLGLASMVASLLMLVPILLLIEP